MALLSTWGVGGVTCKVAVSTPTRQTFCMCFAISLGVGVIGVLFFDRPRRKVSGAVLVVAEIEYLGSFKAGK